MKTTSNLSNDHKNILSMLEVMKLISESIHSGKNVNTMHLESIVDFLKNFADVNHHGKEEKLLFPLLESRGIPRKGGPIGVMMNEHIQGRSYIAAISEDIISYSAGNYFAAEAIASNMNNYIHLLGNHVQKEDNILFPMADRVISESDDSELYARFEAVENETIPSDKRKYYLELAEELKKYYL